MRSQTVLFICMLILCACELPAQDPTMTTDLVVGRVIDDETGRPIRIFHVIPGSGQTRRLPNGGSSELAIWQPHLIREMTEGAFVWPRKRGYDRMKFRIESEGYASTTTEWTGRKQAQIRPVIRLQRERLIRGTVRSPDGSPAAGATLSVSLPNSTVRLDGCKFERSETTPEKLSDWWRIPRMIRCDDSGRFELAAETDPAAVLCVVHPDGYHDERFASFADAAGDNEVTIRLKKWARLEGKIWWLDRPGVGESVALSIHKEFDYPGMIAGYPTAVADEKGNYVIEHVPPGRVQINHPVKLQEDAVLSEMQVRFDYPVFHATLEAGETVRVDVGGEGISVTGKLRGVDSYEGVTLSISPPRPDTFGWFKMGMQAGGNDLMTGYQALIQSDYGNLYFRGELPVKRDGTFEIPNVMTGKYLLRVRGAAIGTHNFQAQTSDQGKIDLGEIQVSPTPVGQNKIDALLN